MNTEAQIVEQDLENLLNVAGIMGNWKTVGVKELDGEINLKLNNKKQSSMLKYTGTKGV